MSEKRKSILELLGSSRTRSLFEQPEDEGRSDDKLKEWEQKWGYIKQDFVNVISYPDENAQASKKENDDWTSVLKIALEEAERNVEKLHSPQVMSSNFSTDQNIFLAGIQSKIDHYLKTTNNMRRDAEVEVFQKLILDEHLKFEEKLIT